MDDAASMERLVWFFIGMYTLPVVVAYLLGSIPFGLILTRWAGLGDIRQVGSGNIGATNVMRTGHKWLGIATLLLDALKGYIAVEIAWEMGLSAGPWGGIIYVVALAAVLGHVFPVWLKFKGGKGVATAFGVMFGLSSLFGLFLSIFWLMGFFARRYVSLASIGSFWLLAVLAVFISGRPEFYLALAALITWTHRANIKRLREGTEPKFEKK